METEAAGWDEPSPCSAPATPEARAEAAARLLGAGVPPGPAERLVGWLATADDEALYAVRLHRLPTGVPVDLDTWVAALDAGVVGLHLLLVCDWCGAVARSVNALCDVQPTFGCNACRYAAPSRLDATIEATFRPAPWLRPLSIGGPPALAPGPAFRVHHFHPGAVAPDGEPYAVTLRDHTRALRRLGPGESCTLELDAAASDVLEVVALPGAASHVTVAKEGEFAEDHRVVWDGSAFHPPQRTIPPGTARVTIESRSDAPVHVFALWIPRSRRQLQPARVPAMVGARDLFLHPRFREGHADVLRPTTGLAIRDVTLWFSDIQGSTATYEEVGDLEAYLRVQRHFLVLDRLVRDEGGVVVKTLGDAVMAAFPAPGGALRAARRALATTDFPLRLGVHRGGALAIDANGIPDLYGQTVNLAARLQGAAAAGEICVSAATLEDAEASVAVLGCRRSAEDATLKGFARPVPVVRLRAA